MSPTLVLNLPVKTMVKIFGMVFPRPETNTSYALHDNGDGFHAAYLSNSNMRIFRDDHLELLELRSS